MSLNIKPFLSSNTINKPTLDYIIDSDDDISISNNNLINSVELKLEEVTQKIQNAVSITPDNIFCDQIKTNLDLVVNLIEKEQLNKSSQNNTNNDIVSNLKKIIEDRSCIIKDLISQINILSTKTTELEQIKHNLNNTHTQLIEDINNIKHEIKQKSDIFSLLTQNNKIIPSENNTQSLTQLDNFNTLLKEPIQQFQSNILETNDINKTEFKQSKTISFRLLNHKNRK